MNALVLAGGQNSRFGSHKALAEVKGMRIIESVTELLSRYFEKIFISTNSPDCFFYLGLPMVGDILDVRGPMTGIYSGFFMTDVSELFVVACDMPFIKDSVIKLLKDGYKGQDVFLPLCNGRPEPLLGIYSGRIKNIMLEHILQNKRALWDLIGAVSAAYQDEESVRRADPEMISFVNINTVDEYREVTGRIMTMQK